MKLLKNYSWVHVSSNGDIVVVGSETDILSPVVEFVLSFLDVGGVVHWDVHNIARDWVVDSVTLDVLNLLDDSGVQEVVWENFVWWWKNDSLGVFTFQDSGGESLSTKIFLVFLES